MRSLEIPRSKEFEEVRERSVNMGNLYKWSRDDNRDSDKIYVVLFTSRNKDNRDIDNFKERRVSFVTTRVPSDLLSKFETFVKEGVAEEFSQMYVSVNARSNSKTFKTLQHQMLDSEFNLASMPQKIASIAAKRENAYDSKSLKWLFDFDPIDDKDLNEALNEFVSDLKEELTSHDDKDWTIFMHKTPNGYAVIVDKRFDTRRLLEKWSNVTLKRDDLYCFAARRNY